MVVVCEGGQHDFISKLVRWATGSRLTHCFIVTGDDEIIEAYIPKVRKNNLTKKLAELRSQDRAYFVLDYPGMAPIHRELLVRRATEYLGRWYDIGQAILYGFARRFRNDGSGTVTCSRLITAVFKEALGYQIFDLSRFDPSLTNLSDLAKGECTPDDLMKSKLVLQSFIPSSRIRGW
jgi:hypothetical protein